MSGTHDFSHIRMSTCSKSQKTIARILPGEYYATRRNELLTTVLGSCIAVCIYDPLLKMGGMNHFMLPKSKEGGSGWAGTQLNCETRFGCYAMENLINALLKMGSSKQRLEFKVFGGGRINSQMNDIGAKNIEFINDFLKSEGYKVTSQDVGSIYPRKVNFYPATGKAQVKKLRSLQKEDIIKQEEKFSRDISKDDSGGDIELF